MIKEFENLFDLLSPIFCWKQNILTYLIWVYWAKVSESVCKQWMRGISQAMVCERDISWRFPRYHLEGRERDISWANLPTYPRYHLSCWRQWVSTISCLLLIQLRWHTSKRTSGKLFWGSEDLIDYVDQGVNWAQTFTPKILAGLLHLPSFHELVVKLSH